MHSSCSPRDCDRKKYCVLSLQTVLAARELRWKNKKLLAESLAQKFPGHRLALAFCTLRMPASLRISNLYKEIVVQLRDVLAGALMIWVMRLENALSVMMKLQYVQPASVTRFPKSKHISRR